MNTTEQRRHDADGWVGYEAGWVVGRTWGKPAPRRMSRTEAAGHQVLAWTLAPILVALIVALVKKVI